MRVVSEHSFTMYWHVVRGKVDSITQHPVTRSGGVSAGSVTPPVASLLP